MGAPLNKQRTARAAVHAALLLYTLIAIGPILLILVNAFKTRKAIFGSPRGWPRHAAIPCTGHR